MISPEILRRYPFFASAPGFTISILAAGHRAVSARLAGPGEHSLDGIARLADSFL